MDDRVFAREGEFVLRAVGDEGVIVPIRNRVGDLDSVYVMSPVAMRVWSLIDGAHDVASIIEAVQDEYDVEPDVAASDVIDFLDALQNAGLIRR